MEKFKINVVIGDRWNDGHGRYFTAEYWVNIDPEAVVTAFNVAQKNTGIQFTRLFQDYGCTELDYSTMAVLANLQILPALVHWDEYSYIELFFNFVKLELPLLTWEQLPSTPEIEIGGYGFFN